MKKSIFCAVFCLLVLPPAVQAKTMYVIDYFKIMVRSQPGEEFKIINQLSSNEKVRLITTEGTWAKVAFGDNKTGWVLRRFIIGKKIFESVIIHISYDNPLRVSSRV